MTRNRLTRAAFLGTSALCAAAPAIAQQDLGEILLDAGKREVQTDTAVPLTRVDQEEIRDRQASTVAELVDSVPGVTLVNGSTPQGSGINIRGFGANSTYGTDQKVLTVIDGAIVGGEELYRLGTQLYTDPLLYSEVEVIRGMVGGFGYATGVVGGVLALETADATAYTEGEIGFAGRQTLQFASNGNGRLSSTTLAWQATERLGFLANYTWRSQDTVEDGDGDEIGNSAFTTPSYLLKAHYDIGAAQRVALSLSETTSTDRDVPYDTFGTSGGVFGNVDRDIDSRVATLSYGYDPVSALIDVDATLSYADLKIDQSYVPGSSPIAPPGGFPTVNADNRYETTRLSVQNTALFDALGARHALVAGIDLTHRDRADADSAPGGTGRRVALHATDEIGFGALTLTPALRYEASTIEGTVDTDQDGTDDTFTSYDSDALVGGLSARYAVANGLSVFASGAYTESLPILDDLETPFDTAPQTGAPNPANDDFVTTSEKARTWEIGAAFDRIGLVGTNDALALKADLFQTRLWDVTSYSGVATVDLHGLELEASYETEAGWYADVNATFIEGSFTDLEGAEGYWSNTPQDTLRVTAGKAWGETLDLSWEAVGAFADDRGADEAAGYTLHNLRATYAPQSGVLEGAEMRLGVENAFDKQVTPALSTRPRPGRTLKVTLARAF